MLLQDMYTRAITQRNRSAIIFCLDCSTSMHEIVEFNNVMMSKAEVVRYWLAYNEFEIEKHFYSSAQLLCLIKDFSDNADIINAAEKLREVEQQIRRQIP